MKHWRYSFLLIVAFLAFFTIAWQTDPLAVLAQHDDATTSEPDTTEAQGDNQPKPSVRELIGYEATKQRLGRNMPSGKGIVMGHVEGGDGRYLPNVQSSKYQEMIFIPHSGPSQLFDHTEMTASIIYGFSGLAPGINTVHFFSSQNWLSDGYLKTGTNLAPSDADNIRLFNHSWISMPSAFADQALKRIDYVIDTHEIVMCVGVNNGRNATVPALLAGAYNTIAVGVSDGNSSGGFTVTEIPGRCKPDIVGPGKLTSYATPVVSACAAMLLEHADQQDSRYTTDEVPAEGNSSRDDGPSPLQSSRIAGKPQTIKAVLMAGAEKQDLWQTLPGKPLDEHLGAGLVNIDNSLKILCQGPQTPGRLTSRYGWDFNSLPPLGRHAYHFETSQPLGEVSMILTWHRRIDGRYAILCQDNQPDQLAWLAATLMTNFDLAVVHIDDTGRETVIAESNSQIDNVEHIHLPQLDYGRYRIDVTLNFGENIPEEIRTQMTWDYALAWRIEQPPPSQTSESDDIHD